MFEQGPSDSDPASPADDAPHESPRTVRPFVLRALPSLLLVGIVATGLNWPYEYATAYSYATASVSHPLVDRSDLSSYRPSLRLAGWPWRYATTLTYSDAEPIRLFSVVRFTSNVALALLLGIAIAVYSSRFSQQAAAGEKKRKTNIRLGDVLVLIFLVAAVLGYWRMLVNRAAADEKLAKSISIQGGSVVRATVVPEFLAKRLPKSLQDALMRITEVDLVDPDDEVISTVVALPHLEALRIGGGQYDVTQLSPVATNPYLWQLRIAGREFKNSGELSWLAGMPQLRTLNLMRTNINAEFVQSLENLPRLRDLDLIHTDVRLADLGKPPWADQVVHLRLPRPAPGLGDTLVMQNWPKLKSLWIFEHDEQTNYEPISLQLASLPALETLGVDALQRFDLDMAELPKLNDIQSVSVQFEDRVGQTQYIPIKRWIRHLKVDRVPSLSTLEVYGPDLESIQLLNSQEGLAVELGAELASVNGMVPYATQQVSDEVFTKWINGFDASDGPTSLSLAGIPLSEVNLTSLAQNNQIHRLDLSRTLTSSYQWKQLAGMESLEELHLYDAVIEGWEVNWLAKNLPNLRRLAVDGSFITTLQIEGASNLNELHFTSSSPYLTAVHIKDVDQLQTKVNLSDEVHHLHIENAPRLRGIVVPGRIPQGSVLRGLPGLEVFAAGGPECDDAMWEELLSKQPPLTKLSLVQTSISSKNLARIAEFKQLKKLVLTGANVDASVIAAVSSIPSLETLVLEDANVSGDELVALGSLSNLQELAIRISDPNTNLLWIGNLKELASCTLTGPSANQRVIGQLTGNSKLVHIGLEEAEITEGLLKPLMQIPETSIRDFGILHCTVDTVALYNLSERHSSIKFRFDPGEIDERLWRNLMRENRVLPVYEQIDIRDYQELLANNDLKPWSRHDPDLLSPALFAIHLALPPRSQLELDAFNRTDEVAPRPPTFMDILNSFLRPPASSLNVDSQTPSPQESENE